MFPTVPSETPQNSDTAPPKINSKSNTLSTMATQLPVKDSLTLDHIQERLSPEPAPQKPAAQPALLSQLSTAGMSDSLISNTATPPNSLTPSTSVPILLDPNILNAIQDLNQTLASVKPDLVSNQ